MHPTSSQVVPVDPITDPDWASLVHRRRSDVFHSPAWLRVLRQTYDFDVRAHVVSGADGRPSAGLVFVPIDDAVGARTVSMPFSDFCDPLVDDSDQWRLLADGLLEARPPLTVKVLFDDVAEHDERLIETGRARWHRADTLADADTIWHRLHQGARRAVRKSQANGVRVRPAESLRDVRTFFELHLQTRKRKHGLLAQPWTFFEAIWDHFLRVGDGHLLLAEHEQRVLAGVLFLHWQDTLYYKLNASHEGSLALRPNDAVLWRGFELAHELGARWLDFGISDVDQEGLIRYKRKYATEERDVRTLRSTSTAADHRSDEIRDVLPRITDLFVRPDVPDEVTEQAGALLYRFFA